MTSNDRYGNAPAPWPCGGGEMAARIRAFDWARTPLGPVSGWPQSLRTTVDLLLPNGFGMVALWGPLLIQLYNDAYRDMMGGKHPLGLGQPTEACWPEVWHINKPIYERVWAGETVTFEDARYPITRSGKLADCWFTLTYSPLKDESGAIAGILVTVFENTKQHSVEERLRESEERFRAFVTASSSVIYEMGPDWSEMRQLDGRGFLMDTPTTSASWLEEYIDADDRPQVMAAIREAIAGKSMFELEHRVRRADGSIGWTLSRAVPILGNGSEIVEWFGAASDVTARKRAEAALRESEARYHALFAASPVPFMVLAPNAPDYTITAANDAFLAATLRTRENLIGRRLFDVFPDDPSREGAKGSDALDASLARVLASRRTDAMERVRYDIVTPDGGFEPHWWLAINAPLLDAFGEVSAIIHQVARVTELHRAEEAEQEGQARLQVLVAELQHRTRNLMGVVRSMSDATMRASVDLEDFEAKFRDRLAALARVQGLLSRLAETDRITFDELLRTELTAHGALGQDERRVTLKGPAHVTLRSSTVQTLAMALHELSTNAFKHGALGAPQGRLAVEWRLEPAADGHGPLLHIDWRESGVALPPADAMRRGSGQGRELIEKALPYQLKAKTRFVLEETGLHCTIVMPVSEHTAQQGG